MHPSTNPHGSTGPTSDAGKQRSSGNATKHGLFAANDFIHESEAVEYADTFAALMFQLTPEGILEETFVAEIMTATWRLRRCRILEKDSPDFSNEQKSVDRARAQSHSILRQSMTELRKLQTERTIRGQLETPNRPGLTDTKQVLTTLAIQAKQTATANKANGLDSLEDLVAKADHDVAMQTPGSLFCKPATTVPTAAKTTPRNATCPCGSGAKYKRCCGTGAPPVLSMAA